MQRLSWKYRQATIKASKKEILCRFRLTQLGCNGIITVDLPQVSKKPLTKFLHFLTHPSFSPSFGWIEELSQDLGTKKSSAIGCILKSCSGLAAVEAAFACRTERGGGSKHLPIRSEKVFLCIQKTVCLCIHVCAGGGSIFGNPVIVRKKTWVRCGCCKSDEDGDDDHRGTIEKSGIERGLSTRESSSLAC